MGGDNRQQPQSNVIIPDTGAAKYWYVDPRATWMQDELSALQSKGISQLGIQQAMEASRSSREDDALREGLARLVQTRPVESSGKLYDPMEQVRLGQQQEAERMSANHQMGPQDVYKTVSIDIGKERWEVPAVFDNMTDYERNIIQYLPHDQWPKSIHQKIEDNARDNLEQGNDPFGNPLKPQKMGF